MPRASLRAVIGDLMCIRVAYCAVGVSPSSADAYDENASCMCVPPPYGPHLLYYNSITNWIVVVPCLSGFLVIMSCALYCERNRCIDITEDDNDAEVFGILYSTLKLCFNLMEVRLERMSNLSLASQLPLTSNSCLTVPVT